MGRYRFDVARQEERLFLMNVLGLASSANSAAKGAAMAHLTKLAKEVAQRKTWMELERSAFVVVIKKIVSVRASASGS